MWVQHCPKSSVIICKRTCKPRSKRSAKYSRKSDSWRSKRKSDVEWTKDNISQEQGNEKCEQCESSKYQKNEQNVKQNGYDNGRCQLESDWRRTLVYDLKCNSSELLHHDLDDREISKNWKWFYHEDSSDSVEYDKLTYSPSCYRISLHIFKYLMYFKLPVHLCKFIC